MLSNSRPRRDARAHVALAWDRKAVARSYWALAAVLCSGHFLVFFDRFLLAVASPLVSRDLRLSDSEMGLLLGPAFALTYGVAALAFGRLADSSSRSLLLVAGLIIWAAGTIGTGLAHSFGMLALARAAIGIGQAAFVPMALTLLVDIVPLQRRGAALSWFTSGSTLGRSAALLAGGALLGWLSLHVGLLHSLAAWRLLFVITALPNLLLLLVIPRVLHGQGLLRSDTSDRGESWEWLRRHPATIGGFAIVAVAPVLATQTAALWLPTMMVRDHGFSIAAAGAGIGAVTLVTAPVGQLAGGWLMDRRPTWRRAPAKLIVAALIAALACMLVIASGLGSALTIAAIGMLNVTLGISTFAGLFGIQALTPSQFRGSTNALFLAFVTFVGTGVGPALAGILSDLGGATNRIGIATSLVIVTGLCAFVASIAAPVVGRRLPYVASAARTAGQRHA